MKMSILANWTGVARPQDTSVEISSTGELRLTVVNGTQWLQCDADEFLMGALYTMEHALPPAKPMYRWRDALIDDLPDNSRIGMQSSVNGSTHHEEFSYSEGAITLEEFTCCLKAVCVAIVKLMKHYDLYGSLVSTLRGIWWD